MPWEIPSDAYDTESIDKGYEQPEPGRYYVQVTAVDEDDRTQSGSPQMTVDYLILSGTTPDQVGREFRDYFSKSPKAVNRVLLFALAVNLTTKEELDAHKKAGTNPRLDFATVRGRNLCIELDKEEYPVGSGKHRVKCGFGIYAANSPKAAGIPIDGAAALKVPDSSDSDPFGQTPEKPAGLFDM